MRQISQLTCIYLVILQAASVTAARNCSSTACCYSPAHHQETRNGQRAQVEPRRRNFAGARRAVTVRAARTVAARKDAPAPSTMGKD